MARQELHDGVGQHQRKLVAAQPGDRLGEGGYRVLVVHHRAVPRLAPGGQPHPLDALLGRLYQVEAALTAVGARHGQGKAADLADRLGDAVEKIGPVVDQPLRPVAAAVLLVGYEREHQIPRRHDAGPPQLPGDDDHHADHVLHVDRAAAPDIAVFDRAGKRVHAPFGRFGRHHVEMPMDQQGATRAVGAREPGEHIAPPGRPGFDVFRLVANLCQLLGDPLSTLGLASCGLGFAGVGGIESDQPADNLDHIIARAGRTSVSTVTSPFLPLPGRLGLAPEWSSWVGPARANPIALAANPCGLVLSEWRNGRRASLRC